MVKKKNRETKTAGRATQMFRAVGLGVLVSLLVMLLLMALVSMIFKIAGSVSLVTAGIAAVIIAAAGGYFGGYTATRILKRNGLMAGFLTSFFLSGLLFLTGFLLSENKIQATNLIKQGILIVGGCFGGVLGVNHREKRK